LVAPPSSAILNPRSASTCSRALRNVKIAMSPFDDRPAPRCRTRQQNSSCVFRCCAARTKEQEKPNPLIVVTELPTRLFPLQRKRRYLTTSRRCDMASYVGGKVTPLPEDVPDNLGLADIDHFAQFCPGKKVPPRDSVLAARVAGRTGQTSLDRGIIREHMWSYTLKTLKCLEIQNRMPNPDRQRWASCKRFSGKRVD